MKNFIENRIIQTTLGCLSIIFLGLLMTHGLKGVMDIFFLDETSYLVRGTKMFGKIPKQWGPLYCLWYRILYVFEGDKVNLFYLNFKLLSILSPTLLFITLTRFSKSIILPFAISVFFLISNFNLPIYPKISFFCMSAILTTIFLSTFLKEKLHVGLLFSFAALLLSYMRPEFYLSFLLITLVTIGLGIIKRSIFEKKFLVPIIGFILLAGILHAGIGNPLFIKFNDENRSILAFSEHFAYNYAIWSNSELYLWLTSKDVFSENFGEANSITAALKANGTMFWKHILSNVNSFITSFSNLITALLLPFKVPKLTGKIVGIIIILVIGLNSIRNYKKFLRLDLLLLSILAIPTLISCILIYPRNHYLVLLVPIISLLLILNLDFFKQLKGRASITVITLLTLLILVLGPKANDFTYFEIRKEEGVLNNQAAIKLFKQVPNEVEMSLLSNEGDFSEFSGNSFNWIKPSDKNKQDFKEFFEEQDIDVIYITQTIQKNPYYASDSSWYEFLDNFESYGYNKLSLGEGIQEYFIIENSLNKYFKN